MNGSIVKSAPQKTECVFHTLINSGNASGIEETASTLTETYWWLEHNCSGSSPYGAWGLNNTLIENYHWNFTASYFGTLDSSASRIYAYNMKVHLIDAMENELHTWEENGRISQDFSRFSSLTTDFDRSCSGIPLYVGRFNGVKVEATWTPADPGGVLPASNMTIVPPEYRTVDRCKLPRRLLDQGG
ncbi:MAG TPA: hypothetical protein VEK08_16555 [Planctomycetota bacterium]|nr:hypothetical protein [Planctomycetota bacterium]